MKALIYSELAMSSMALILKQKGYLIDTAKSLLSIRREIVDTSYDACIIELSKNTECTISDIAPLREFNKITPIIMTFGGQVKSEVLVQYLGVGVDHVFAYPYNMLVAIAMLETLQSRVNQFTKVNYENGTIAIGQFSYDISEKVLSRGDSKVSLTYKESVVFTVLAKANGNYVSRSALVKAGWYGDNFYNGRSLDVLLYKLRKKLEAISSLNDARLLISNDSSNYKLVLINYETASSSPEVLNELEGGLFTEDFEEGPYNEDAES